MNKKIIGIIAIVIIVIGIIVTAIQGVNFDLVYKEHKEIDIYIGKDFNSEDIEKIAKEVFGDQKVIVSKVELFQDMVTLKTENITDDQKAELNKKINEKYVLDNKVDDIQIMDIPKISELDLIKPYILPVVIALILVEAYLVVYLIIYKKQSKENVEISIPKSMLELFISVVGVQLVYFSIISITRFPVNRLVIPISILLFITTTIVKFIKNDK